MKPNMIRKTFLLTAFTCLGSTLLLAEPTPAPKSKASQTKTAPAQKITPTKPLASGWSFTNGVWTHVDGYKIVKGQVVRSGVQTHKKAPPPPTKAEMDAAMIRKPAPKTAADIEAEKSKERERNLAPRPARQTGTNL
jgi:hypothetical protein